MIDLHEAPSAAHCPIPVPWGEIRVEIGRSRPKPALKRPEIRESARSRLRRGRFDLYQAAIALDEAAIALNGRLEDGLVSMEAQVEDMTLPRARGTVRRR